MRIPSVLYLCAAASAVALAGCAAESKTPPISTDPVGAASQMPQSPDSLPLGSATAAPLDPGQGDVANTRVGSSRPASRTSRGQRSR